MVSKEAMVKPALLAFVDPTVRRELLAQSALLVFKVSKALRVL